MAGSYSNRCRAAAGIVLSLLATVLAEPVLAQAPRALLPELAFADMPAGDAAVETKPRETGTILDLAPFIFAPPNFIDMGPKPTPAMKAAYSLPPALGTACKTCGPRPVAASDPDWGNSCAGRFCGGIYHAICTPDPCYEGKWTPIADSGFFTATVYPVSQMKFGWDSAFNMILPDRAEYFWARADGKGRGPNPPPGFASIPSLRYNQLNFYVEAASGRFSLIVDTYYRSLDPAGAPQMSGWGDSFIGGKSLLFDSELLQVAFQFLAYMPSGDANKGLGVGHFSLEPTLLAGLRLAKNTYLQNQLSEWIPLNGDQTYQGSMLHYHFSLNQLMCQVTPGSSLVGNAELNGWSFQTGAYTDPILGSLQRASGFTYVSAGPGLRLFCCENRIDVGAAASFALTDPHFAGQLYRVEFRWRY